MRVNMPVTAEEYVLPEGEVIVTRTNLKGVITYANEAFARASEFSREELLGQPHNIVRHPDMPAAAFADLWQTVKAGRPWSALVKNRRKNGGFYWVMANVTAILTDGSITGYMSVRTRPSTQEAQQAEALYCAMREGRAKGVKLLRGRIRHDGLRGFVERLVTMPFFLRCLIAASSFAVAFAGVAVVAWTLPSGPASVWLGLLSLGGVAASGVFCWWATTQLGKPLDGALRVAARVAAGDVSLAFPKAGDPEFMRLFRMLDQMNAKLIGVLKDVHGSTQGVQSAASEIASGNVDLSRRTEEQASALEQTAASMEQLTGTVRQNADNARQANDLAAGASGVATKGGEAVGRVVATMRAINQSSHKIAEIVAVIDGIAFQTNILALNAAVEAARAGEQGRGFAIVAGEVRSLAQRSASAAKEIKGLIAESVNTVEEGATLVDAARQTMGEIVDSVQRLTAIMSEIASASQEQSTGIEQVNGAVTHMDQATQQNAALVEQVASSTEVLSQQVSVVCEALGAFQLGSAPQRRAVSSVASIPHPAPAATPARAAGGARSDRKAQPAHV